MQVVALLDVDMLARAPSRLMRLVGLKFAFPGVDRLGRCGLPLADLRVEFSGRSRGASDRAGVDHERPRGRASGAERPSRVAHWIGSSMLAPPPNRAFRLFWTLWGMVNTVKFRSPSWRNATR